MKSRIWLPIFFALGIGGFVVMQMDNLMHDRRPSDAVASTVQIAATGVAQPPFPTTRWEKGPENTLDQARLFADGGLAPESAFAIALSRPAGTERFLFLQAAFNRWILAAPAEALANIERIPSGDRQKIVALALASLAQRRPEQFLDFANGIGDNHAIYMADAMSLLAKSNPALALTLAHRHPASADPHGVIISALLPELTRTDLTLAARTVSDMKDLALSSHIQQVATAYARQSPRQAYEWVSRILADRSDIAASQVLDDVTSSVVASNPAEAVKYLDLATDPLVRKSLLGEISIQKGQEDLTAAWVWLNDFKGDEHYREAALNLLYRWSYVKPEEVARILPGVTETDVQIAAATHLSRFWKKNDPKAYQAWLSTLAPGVLKNSATEAH